jgi:hypothetical protein
MSRAHCTAPRVPWKRSTRSTLPGSPTCHRQRSACWTQHCNEVACPAGNQACLSVSAAGATDVLHTHCTQRAKNAGHAHDTAGPPHHLQSALCCRRLDASTCMSQQGSI